MEPPESGSGRQSMIYSRATTLMEANLGDEMVALDPGEGLCFGFNEAAARIWQLLAEPRSFEELVDMLLGEFDVSLSRCRADLSELLDDLIDKKLVAAHT